MSVIHLSCGKTSAVIRKMGAQMISFKGEDGREVMWQGDAAVWEDTSPVLFPVCGSPVGRQVTIDGRSYPMPQHGFASRCDFEVLNCGDNFVDLILIPNEECRDRPFPAENGKDPFGKPLPVLRNNNWEGRRPFRRSD